MSYVSKVFGFLRAIVKTFRLALPKLGVGWMFALLTINFNRIAIHELAITAVIITTMLGLHYFLSPFQVISGRIADRFPIAGYRRTPYLLISSIVGSLIFLALPSTVHAMGDGAVSAFVAGFALLILYGVCIALMGDAHHSLIAEVTESKSRGAVISVVWTFTIISTIIASVIMQQVLPEYSAAGMQRLYNLTPFIVIGSTLLGVIGMEKRLNGEELKAAIVKAKQVAPAGNPLRAAATVLRNNSQARGFFAFVFVAIFSIFLQDNILEVFGAEVFDMSLEETSGFQQIWGGGVLIGMIVMGILSAILTVSKRKIALLGCVGTAAGMVLLAGASLFQVAALVTPALFLMGLFTGFFNVGSLSMMMDMTVEGATGLYMGLWGMAQAFGNGASSFGSGALHTGLIESGLFTPGIAYFGIFAIEAIGMTTAAVLLWRLSVKRFHTIHEATISREDALLAMEAGAVA